MYSRDTYRPIYTEQYNIINIISNFESLKGIFKVQRKFPVSIKLKKKKENSFIFGLLLFMDLVMIGAGGWGIVQLWQLVTRHTSTLSPDSLFMALFWNTINICFLSSVIVYLYRYNTSLEKKKVIEIEKNAPLSSEEYKTFIRSVAQDPVYAFSS